MKKIIFSLFLLLNILNLKAIDPEANWTKVAPYDTQWASDAATHELSFTGTAPTTGTKAAITSLFNNLTLNPTNATLNQYAGLKLTFDAYVSGTLGDVTSVIMGWTSGNNKGCHIQIDKDKIQVVGITGTTIITLISDGSYSAIVNQNAYNSFEINVASDGLSFTVKINNYTCPTTITTANNTNAIARLTAGATPTAFCTTFTNFKLRNVVASRLGIVKEYYTYTTPIAMNGDWWPQAGQEATPPSINGWYNNSANSSLNFEGTILIGTRIATTFGSIGAPYTGINLKFDATIDPTGQNTMIVLGSNNGWPGPGININISKDLVQALKNFDYGATTMMSSDVATYQALLAGGGVRACEINVSSTGLITVTVAGYVCPTTYQADITVLANTFVMVCPAVTGFKLANVIAKKAGVAKSYFPNYTYAIAATANDNAKGSVTGAGAFEKTSDVTLTATPSAGYRFVKWTDGGVDYSTANPLIFEATVAKTLVAVFDVSTAVSKATNTNFSVYPNPTKSDITIVSDAVGKAYSVKNVLGQNIVNGTITSVNHKIDLSNQKVGVYMITVQGETTKMVRTILKN